MARQARIDAPGALHHIIARGIERQAIFRDHCDKDRLLYRFGRVLLETSTPCYAWALMDNHFHLLLKTGSVPVATVMRRLLTGYAQYFNRRYQRHGPLFQNRYKSILCEESPYLLELVRYIHLNPLRAKVVSDLQGLISFPYTGHGVMNGQRQYQWQYRDYVLSLFAATEKQAIINYNEFVAEGVAQGNRAELVGGGLLRSIGGWSALKLLRSQGSRIKGDERILGSSDFVARVLKEANELPTKEESYRLQGLDLETLVQRTASHYSINPEELKRPGKDKTIVTARAVLCYLAVRKLQMSGADTARALNLSPSSVSKAVKRGQTIVRESKVGDFLLEC